MLSKSRKGIQSDRYKKKRRGRLVVMCVLWIVAVGSVVTALSLLSKADFLRIASVEVTGTDLVSADTVQTTVEDSLAGDWWRLFARDSIFLYPKSAIASMLMKEYPPIASVDFSHTGLHVLNVEINERTPFALTCIGGDSPQCYYIDATGFVYAPAPQFSPGVYVTYDVASSSAVSTSAIAESSATSTTSAVPAVGEYVTDPQDFGTAGQAVDYFSGLGLGVVGITVPSADAVADASSGNYFTIYLKRPGTVAPAASVSSTTLSGMASTSPTIAIYFNTAQPIETTMEYFSAFWQHETDKNFQYIDLRYGKDIVFKME